MNRYLAGVFLAVVGWASPAPSAAADDLFQKAVDYVFTGTTEPTEGPEIADRAACVVVVPDTRFKRFARYYLRRFKMDASSIVQKYSGSHPYYELDVGGDGVILEYLGPDKASVTQSYKSAQISLPGNIDDTRKALQIIFSDFCKVEKPKTTF